MERLSKCGRVPHGEYIGVHVVDEPDGLGRRGTTRGLQSCGSVWCCPVCAGHIRHERSIEIRAAVEAQLQGADGDRPPGGLVFATLTVRHQWGDALDDLLSALIAARGRTFSGSPWKRVRERYGITGYVATIEVTHGENGWHPHQHLLLLTSAPLDDGEAVALWHWLATRWRRNVEREGLEAPTLKRGTVLEVVENVEGASAYLAKVQDGDLGLEMTRGDLKEARSKTSRVPFQLLDAAAEGDREALQLWWEYEEATHGRRFITWSRDIRDELGLGDERTDDEITADDHTSDETLVALVHREDWALICCHGLEYDVLVAAEEAGLDGVLQVVQLANDRERSRGDP